MSLETVAIADIGDGFSNRAAKLMAGLAYDPALSAHGSLCDIDQAAAERDAKIGARFADV